MVADLHVEWYRRYNKDYNDNLTVNDPRVSSWDLHLHVKPECGSRIYAYLGQPGLYDAVPITAGAEAGVLKLREFGHRIVFATSCVSNTTDAKFEWLNKFHFLHNRRSRKDYVSLEDKSLLRGDVLIDDAIHNIEGFSGYGILFDAPWNRSFVTDDTYTFRAKGWGDVVDIVCRLAATREDGPVLDDRLR